MEPNREPIDKPTHLPSINFQQKRQEYTMWQGAGGCCISSASDVGKAGLPGNSMQFEHSIIPYTKINSKWLKDLHVKHDAIKFLDENIGKTFSDINHNNVFLGQSPKAIETKAKI